MFKKGQSGNPSGKKPGTKNRLPRDLVERIIAIEQDLTEKGKGLQACAEESPQWFLEQFVKPLIPKNVSITGEDGGPIQAKVEVIFVNSENKS